MKKWIGLLLMVLLLSACGGSPSQEDVVKEISDKARNAAGYKAKAILEVQAGEEKQTYNVDIWNQRHTNYRVHLSSVTNKHSQTIVKNKTGIYVMTPSLGKSFRYENNWPENSSQSYLFESLAADIQADGEAVFKETEDYYVFQTKTRYTNSQMLPKQEISFHKKNFTPALVKVMDTKGKVVISVVFKKMDLKPKFAKDDFSEKKAAAKETAGASPSEFMIHYPTETGGAELADETRIDNRVILTYEGSKPFTLIEQPAVPSEEGIARASGDLSDMGFAAGEAEDGSLHWVYNGVEFMLASDELSQGEMARIAASISPESVK
ncbi:outer membrane lipoprotein carrier protein LolA [Domibacillus sp. PGB-M46]|uniref:LolA family protein n=1 Tax=Domibacillus sp. PGB-M46 TaxID=2910255 RepID=UPI001F585C08|nr:outer membrane lipoprotein carrier protein LolA [Domibacillus sp. PGB-M46]MCI2255923.1 outer membrane lipoprotein carrier protein LolA [Domibacillus sp. PGB-M46]